VAARNQFQSVALTPRANIINYGRFDENYEAQLSSEENEKILMNYHIIHRYIYNAYAIKYVRKRLIT
jgi:hypothetical protein